MPNDRTVNPDDLFNYACRYARRQESKGRGTVYPTFRQAANRFRVTFDELEVACEDFDSSKGYMKPQVGIGSNGGCGVFEHRGEYRVEAYT